MKEIRLGLLFHPDHRLLLFCFFTEWGQILSTMLGFVLLITTINIILLCGGIRQMDEIQDKYDTMSIAICFPNDCWMELPGRMC